MLNKKNSLPYNPLQILNSIGAISLGFFQNSLHGNAERAGFDINKIVLSHENNYTVIDNNLHEIRIIVKIIFRF